MTATLLLVAAVAAIATWALTGVVLRYARHTDLLDHPNDRSSHTMPTPRGGGLAIVVVSLFATVTLAMIGVVSERLAIAYVGGGALVAAIGWRDDRRHVRASLRGATHLVSAAWAVAWLGGMPALRLAESSVPLGTTGGLLAVLAVTWSTNAFNFMDGVDGIAGVEGACVGLTAAVILAGSGHVALAAVSFALGAACAGFLPWNWAPASIFMGDVGSGFVGFAIGCLAVASENARAMSVWAWLLLYGVFAFDATVTLVRRVSRGERWYAAHRSHAYQRFARTVAGHSRVAIAVLALNACLAILAIIGEGRPALRGLMLGAAVLILLGAYLVVQRREPFSPPDSP